MSAAWSVRAALLCEGVERAADGTVLNVFGVCDRMLADEAGELYEITRGFFLALLARVTSGPFTLRLEIESPDGARAPEHEQTFPGLAAGNGVEILVTLTAALSSLGTHWVITSVDGTEISRVPLRLELRPQRVSP